VSFENGTGMPKLPGYSEPSYFCVFNSPSKKSLKAIFQLQELVGKNPKIKLLNPKESILYTRKKKVPSILRV